MEIRKNITLIVGIAIPVGMILFVAGMIYLPGLFIKPQFDFIYATGQDYYYRTQLVVRDGRLEIVEGDYPESQTLKDGFKLYYYDASANESQEISVEKAQSFKLDSNYQSPDGFEVVRGRSGGFFNGGSDYSTVYLKGHNVSRKLNVKLPSRDYYNFHFVGWVVD